jgi:unsaturated chondroitin disaccharide hydrolase
LEAAERVSHYFIEHLPEDKVPFFDFNVPKDALKYVPKDTSSASIAASGLMNSQKMSTI